jgi:hypothetical protein
MPNTFLNKVSVERGTLAIINKRYSKKNQLTGLSVAAIEQWRSKITPEENRALIVKILEISRIAQTLSNKSNETFNDLTDDVKSVLERLMADLSRLVHEKLE